MITQLELPQLGTLNELRRMGIGLAFVGLDVQDRPVVLVRDVRRTFAMAIAKDGSGKDLCDGPLREFSEKETELFMPSHFDFLMSLPATLPD